MMPKANVSVEARGEAAAGNRLANVVKKGYIFRIERSRPQGDLFITPSMEPQPSAPPDVIEEPSDGEVHIPAEIRDSVAALAKRRRRRP